MKHLFQKRFGSSRKQIQIKGIMDDVLILPNHQYRLILETSSVNFELKSEEEQDVIIDSFQNFLNSLPSSIQILVRVREIDIDHYLEQIVLLKDKEKETIYQTQIDNYTNFVRKLVKGNKILSRRFYIVLPFTQKDRNHDTALIKEQLYLQRDIVIKGLERMQMKARTLSGLEIINLFYSFYNPESIKTQEITKETLKSLLTHTYV
jgi:hypothetical protein